MIDPVLYLAFLPAALALTLTPGPDMLFAMAQGLRGGRPAAIAAAAGIGTGVFVNAALAGLGLGALVSAAPWLFGVIRWVGVAYLLWLAVKTLRTRLDAVPQAEATGRRVFRDGLVVNLSNPSVILFILAFIPQFVDPARAILPQFLVYGATIALLGFAIKAGIGASAGGIGRAFIRNPRIERGLRWASAGIFGALAARMALSGARA